MSDEIMIEPEEQGLFDRVSAILEQARANVVRSVNHNTLIAYWLIGREIVEEIQGGKERAEYGQQILDDLSTKLTSRYGTGFSVPNLRNFRKFYLTFQARKIQYPTGRELDVTSIQHPKGSDSSPFSPQLTWSHYRALMRVKKDDARVFYEQEAIECGWDKRALERHIHSHYYERMLKSQHPEAMKQQARDAAIRSSVSVEMLKNPYVLEFLGLPEVNVLHETEFESAIITHLQAFLLELGKGFAFVARQKRMRYEDSDLYVDLVFYNCILKCYLLIDLKVGELTHKDVGQMDSYVRMFDDLHTAEDDNSTIGLILCTEKNEAVARYSVLNERKQIFASKYMPYLPTVEELEAEIMREQRLIRQLLSEKDDETGDEEE